MRLITFVELRVVAGRSRKRAGRPHAVIGWPMLIRTCHVHPALCRGLEKSLSEGQVLALHRHDMTCVNQTQPQCVNQMGKTQSKPLAARHGMCELAFTHGFVGTPVLCFICSVRNIWKCLPNASSTYFKINVTS
jgi:hypothetical protein